VRSSRCSSGAEEGDFSRAYDEAADRRPSDHARGLAYTACACHLASMVLTTAHGLPNRRGFDQRSRARSRGAASGSELALLALDLDHFKMIKTPTATSRATRCWRAAGALLQTRPLAAATWWAERAVRSSPCCSRHRRRGRVPVRDAAV